MIGMVINCFCWLIDMNLISLRAAGKRVSERASSLMDNNKFE